MSKSIVGDILCKSKYVRVFSELIGKNSFYYSYDLPFTLYSKLYKIYTSSKINRILLDNFYPLCICRKFAVFLYPYKNDYTIIPLSSQIFHSTLFSCRKVTIFVNSEQHKDFFKNTSLEWSAKLYTDELLSLLFEIKVKKMLGSFELSGGTQSNEKMKILITNGLIKVEEDSISLTKIGKILLKNFISPLIYIKVKEFLHRDSESSNLDNLCIYLLHLLGYSDCSILWEKVKKLLEGQIEFVEEHYKVSAGLLFNIVKRVFNILLCLDDTMVLPPSIRCELLQLKGRFETGKTELSLGGKIKEDVTPTKEIILDTNKYTVAVNGKEISLPLGSFKLLYILIQNQGKLVPYNQLYTKMYGKDDSLFKYRIQNEKTYLCKKLKKLGIDTSIIENIAYQGYRMDTKDYTFKIKEEN